VDPTNIAAETVDCIVDLFSHGYEEDEICRAIPPERFTEALYTAAVAKMAAADTREAQESRKVKRRPREVRGEIDEGCGDVKRSGAAQVADPRVG
jgi:hypothetical protein